MTNKMTKIKKRDEKRREERGKVMNIDGKEETVVV